MRENEHHEEHQKIIAAALCGISVVVMTGCAGSTLKPEDINGVYRSGDQTNVATYKSEIELNNKEKYYEYQISINNGDKYKDNLIYTRGTFLINPKDGTISTANPFTGAKKKFGQIKNNKMIITTEDKVIGLKTGEYTKTKDPIPDEKTLNYGYFKAEADKMKNNPKLNQPYHSKFEELAKAKGLQ